MTLDEVNNFLHSVNSACKIDIVDCDDKFYIPYSNTWHDDLYDAVDYAMLLKGYVPAQYDECEHLLDYYHGYKTDTNQYQIVRHYNVFNKNLTLKRLYPDYRSAFINLHQSLQCMEFVKLYEPKDKNNENRIQK